MLNLKFCTMKTKMLFLLMIVFANFSIYAQSFNDFKSKLAQAKQESYQKVKTNDEISPKENLNVEKKYDEEGNLIGYNSTYSYSSVGESPEKVREMVEDFDNLFFNFQQLAHSSYFEKMDEIAEFFDEELSEKYNNGSAFETGVDSRVKFLKEMEGMRRRMEISNISRKIDKAESRSM